MKLLVLSPVYPDAPSDGDRVRLFHWLRELARRNEIHLLAFGDPAREADRSLLAAGPTRVDLSGTARMHVQLLPLSLWQRRFAALARLFSPLPVTVASAVSGAMARAVDDAVARAAAQGATFDAVFCYRLKMAPYALRFRGPRFLDYTDCLTRYAERRAVAARLAGHPFQAAWFRLQARRNAAYEAWCAGQFDAAFLNGAQDCQTLRSMAPAFKHRLHVAANGVRPFSRSAERRSSASLAPSPGRFRRIVFVGHLAYAPNAEAVAWFADHVWPLIRREDPEVEFVVVGGAAPPSLRAYEKRPGLRFTGAVPDVAAVLKDAALSVCPVHSGAGRQNKLLEAFAAGVPAVATRLAAEGAEAVDGRDLLVADEPSAFAAACLRLLRQPALGRRLAAGGRRLVHRLYRWERNAAGLERVMRQTLRRALW